MIYVEQHTAAQLLKVSEQKKLELAGWLRTEIEDGLSARNAEEHLWRDMLRLYEGVPKIPVRNTPIENAPNIEVTLGAIAADAIYAQSLDLIYTASPMVTARATNAKWLEHAKALQLFIDWAVEHEFGLRTESEQAILDDCQLGTGVYYIPWLEYTKKTASSMVVNAGPRIMSVPPEDFLVPGGSYHDVQTARWAAMRTWIPEHELAQHAADLEWDVERFGLVGNVGWVRSRRETLGRTTSSRRLATLYEVWRVYCYYDIDGDGLYEDLLVVWDRTSGSIGKIVYCPFDWRPFEPMRYQIRGHLFYGIGVVEMLRGFQEEVTELHNHRTTNVMLANLRLWKSRTGALPGGTMRIWANKVIELDDPSALQGEQLGDVYPSIAQAEMMTLSLAERRVGVNELSLPRPSQVMGSRTPGITALSLLQQVNRRFTPAFEGMKLATAGAVRQALWRYSEQIKAGNEKATETIRAVLSDKDSQLVLELLRQSDFSQNVKVMLTASSAQTNREAERQNAIMLVSVLSSYYDRVLQLTAIASNPQTAQPVRDVAIKIAKAGSEIIDRTIRTFDQIRDPRAFVIDVEAELDSIQGLSQGGLQGLGQLLQQQMAQLAPGAGPNGNPVG